MLKIIKGDLLKATENLICHQCNEQGMFGGGLAYQIRQAYPHVETQCREYSREFSGYGILRHFQIIPINDNQSVVNCFTQKDFVTQYDAVKEVFTYLKYYAKENNLSIAIPYKYGCGIAKGNWEEVEQILLDIFDDYDITIYKFGK